MPEGDHDVGEAARGVRAVARLQFAGRVLGELRAAGEQALLVFGQRLLDVVLVVGEQLGQLGGIEHRQVGAVSAER